MRHNTSFMDHFQAILINYPTAKVKRDLKIIFSLDYLIQKLDTNPSLPTTELSVPIEQYAQGSPSNASL